MNEIVSVVLTKVDVQNLLNLLARSRFEGLAEAEVAVVLKQKLVGALQPAPQQVSANDVE